MEPSELDRLIAAYEDAFLKASIAAQELVGAEEREEQTRCAVEDADKKIRVHIMRMQAAARLRVKEELGT
jgi:hypothetical protein